jgi:hypothetical protein
MVDFSVDCFAAHMSMVVCPAPDDGVEFLDKFSGCCGSVGLDDGSDFLELGFDVLLCWLDDEFAIVTAHILSQEVKTLVDVCQLGFL